MLLNHKESAEQKAHITGILFEMVNLLVDDLKAPRFIDTGEGLAMMSGEKVSAIH
ncbi:hypothetical protein M979_3498 [Buttiauxella noackiae ATCC 51607]|uniref:Uncharacterized protein n=1 Tax=Buttiauxella noackiae ATCC 51607 TaxID=1354255 RepID=A0A1B7HIX9_9ENTR|nr:hypothetical protein M979_3498 [Buttiauxella noackiae ATCC 51607]